MTDTDNKGIAAIGSDEFTLGFRLAGVGETHNPEDYRDKIQELIERDDLGIIVAEKHDLEELPERIRKKVDSSVDPVVVSLSESAESDRLNEKIRRVIGADIT